jgi:N-acetylneuraminate lyase
LTRAQELQDISQVFVEALLDIGVLPGMKAGFAAIGIDVGPTRAPMLLRGTDGAARMAEVMARPEISAWLA